MALGRWPFTVLQRARGMAYSFAGPSRGVHRGSGEGACDKTRPHYLCDSLSSTGRLAKSEDTTYFRKTGDRGTCRGCGEKNWKSCMHSAAEKSGRFGVCVCHTITARYGNRSHLDSQRISGLEGVCDMLIVGGMSCVGREGACQSVCMSLRKSPAEQQRATTFHVRPVACSKCLFFVTSTPCPARRTHPAHAVFTLQTSRLGRISQSLRFYDGGMRKMNTMITALVPARCTCIQSPPTERAEQG